MGPAISNGKHDDVARPSANTGAFSGASSAGKPYVDIPTSVSRADASTSDASTARAGRARSSTHGTCRPRGTCAG